MSHLSPVEFIDFAEGTLPPARASHLRACDACRGEADTLHAALLAARSTDIPEPSPLFWDHFSARVRERISEAPEEASSWWRPRVAILATAITVLLVAVTLDQRPPQLVPPPALVPGAHIQPATADSQPDAAWEMLASLAEESPANTDTSLDATHALGLSVRPATLDRAVEEMSATEREELGRLLQDELKRSGA